VAPRLMADVRHANMPLESRFMWIFRPVRLRHCASLRQFVFRILTQQFAVKIIVALSIVALVPEADSRKTIIKDPLIAVVSIVFLAPILETLLFQTLPIELSRLFNRPLIFQFFAGMIPFAGVHFLGGVVSGVAAGVVGGIFFCYTYLECRSTSWWKSTWVTTVTHGLHNVIVLPVLLVMASST